MAKRPDPSRTTLIEWAYAKTGSMLKASRVVSFVVAWDVARRQLDKPRITALNKVDALADADGRAPRSLADIAAFQESLSANIPGAVLVSAEKGWGLDALRERVVDVIDRERSQVGSRR